MTIPVIKPTNAEMMKCVARAMDVKGTYDGFPDSDMPGCRRELCNYMGFSKPQEEGASSPVGDTAKPVIQHLSAGFGIGFVKAAPGNGVPFHVHDTNETFMVLEGTWRVEWQGVDGIGGVTLDKHDLISVPPNVQRRFESVAVRSGLEQGILLGVLAGDNPSAEYAPESVAWLVAAGKLPAPAPQPAAQSAAAV